MNTETANTEVLVVINEACRLMECIFRDGALRTSSILSNVIMAIYQGTQSTTGLIWRKSVKQ